MNVFFSVVLRREKESDPEVNLVFKADPNEGESCVTNDEEALRYSGIAVREGLASYDRTRRYYPPAFCCHCARRLWKKGELYMHQLLDRPHFVIMHRYETQIAYAVAYHCGDLTCTVATEAYAKRIAGEKFVEREDSGEAIYERLKPKQEKREDEKD